MGDYEVVASFVIVTVIVRGIVNSRLLLVAPRANAIHRWIVQNFFAFVIGQMLCLVAVQDLCKIYI